MSLPSRHQMEFRLNLNAAGGGRRGALPDGTIYRLDKSLRRRAETLGLRVFGLRIEATRLLLDVLLQPHMVKENIERALHSAITAVLSRDMPHLVKRTGFRGKHSSGDMLL